MISTIGIVSLSSGVIGEDFVKHEVDLGLQRLKDLGLNLVFLPHSLKGVRLYQRPSGGTFRGFDAGLFG